MSVNNIKCNIATIDKDNSIDFVVCDKLGLWLSENSKCHFYNLSIITQTSQL